MNKKTAINSVLAILILVFLTATGAAADANWLVINEIHYNPDSYKLEFVELYNNGPCYVPLGNIGVEFDNGVTFNFPYDAEIQAGEYILFVRDADEWVGASFQVFEFGGTLADGGDTISVISTLCGASAVNDTVTYDDEVPWPEDGVDGYDEELQSIELINPDLDNEVAGNWAGSLVEGGTPGAANSVLVP